MLRFVTQQGGRHGEHAGQGDEPLVGEGWFDYAKGACSWNAAKYLMLGLEADGRPADEVAFERMHPSDRANVAETLARVVAHPGPFAGQYRIRDAHGRERSVAFVGDIERTTDGRPVLDEAGRPVRLRGIGFDVSAAARVAAAEAVAAATADRAAIEQVKGALMFGHGLDADAAFALLARYSQVGNVKVSVLARRTAELLSEPAEGDAERSVLHALDRALRSVADDGVGIGCARDARRADAPTRSRRT